MQIEPIATRKRSNQNLRWDDHQEYILRLLFEKSALSIPDIAVVIGRTDAAVRSRAIRLGMIPAEPGDYGYELSSGLPALESAHTDSANADGMQKSEKSLDERKLSQRQHDLIVARRRAAVNAMSSEKSPTADGRH